jgi:voltage-gated potassium channel Kch
VYYGDASRVDLLRAAGAERARVLVVAVDEPQKAQEIAEHARKHFPHLAVLARARGRAEAYGLLDLGLEGVYRETFDTSLRLGADVLSLLGWSAHRARRSAQVFRRMDEAGLREMAAVRGDQARLIATARERIALLERVLQEDKDEHQELRDPGWELNPDRDVRAREEPAVEARSADPAER